MNWNKIAGVLLIFGASTEMLSIIKDYNSGKLAFWPFGADIGCIAMIILGVYLIHKGSKKVNKLN